MDFFITRQPVFTTYKRLYAYDLLYRGKETSSFSNESANKAATCALTSTFLTEGFESISDSHPCFINFTRDLLLQNIPASFPKTQVIVELHKNVAATPDTIAICRKLKSDGYTIALDDFVYDPELEPLISLADIIKIDYPITPENILRKTLEYLSRRRKVKCLAQKIESYDDFEKAKEMGFTYFQGYFFCQPENDKKTEIDSSKVSQVRLLAEINRKTTTREKFLEILQADVGLSYKLLRYINSSYFYRLSKIESVPHAIAYLGDVELRRFLILMLISAVASDKPNEVIRLALVRAKMIELLAMETEFKNKADEIFLLGLFSLVAALLDTTMDDIAEQLSLSDRLKNCLVNKTGPYAPFLETVITYEKRDKIACLVAVQEINVAPGKLHQLYLEAIKFTQSVLD